MRPILVSLSCAFCLLLSEMTRADSAQTIRGLGAVQIIDWASEMLAQIESLWAEKRNQFDARAGLRPPCSGDEVMIR